MAWTYTDDPANNTTDAVRFLIGDTIETEPLLSDGEIEFALDQTANIYMAAAIASRGIAGKFSRGVFTKFDAVSQNLGRNAEQYLDLAMRLEVQSRRVGAAMGLSAGGVPNCPTFWPHQFDNPPADPSERT